MSESLLLRRCSKIITQNMDRDVLSQKDILVDDGEISKIGQIDSEEAEKEIDCNGRIVLPGLVNTHTHLGGVQYRGYCDDEELFEWIRHTASVTSELSDEERLSARMISIAKMLKSGTTLFNDMTDLRTAKAAQKGGIKAMMGQNLFNDMLGVFEADHRELLDANREFIKEYRDHDLIYPAVPVHAIYTCTRECLIDAKNQAEELAFLSIYTSQRQRKKIKIAWKRGV